MSLAVLFVLALIILACTLACIGSQNSLSNNHRGPEYFPNHEAYLASRGAIKPNRADKFIEMLKSKDEK